MRLRFKPWIIAACVTGSLALPMSIFAAENESTVENKSTVSHSAPAKNSSYGTKNNHSKKTPVSRVNKQQIIETVESLNEILPIDLDVPGQAFVSTGPYVGVPFQYAGSDLIINSPSVNTDLQLLQIRKNINNKIQMLIHEGITELPNHSHLIFSGIAEVQAGMIKPDGRATTSDFDLTNVSLDAFFIGPSHWTQGFVEFSYDNDLPYRHSFRVSNSNVFINKAFITIGDLLQSPFYATVGQYFVPFGTYSTTMVSDPLTKLLGRTKARALTLGYYSPCENRLQATAFLFRGDTHQGSVSRINNGGLSAMYHFKGDGFFSGEVGGGVIANLADSGGMQIAGNFTNYERIDHRVPAYDVRGILHVGKHVDLLGEVVGAASRFNVNDLSYNNHGAHPLAADVLATYSFMILQDRPSSLGLGYGVSHEALALGIPDSRYSVVFNTSLWRNTLQSLEFRHDVGYGSSNTANGPIAATKPNNNPCKARVCVGTRDDNVLTAQFDYYF